MCAPDPKLVRDASRADIAELGFPNPPSNFPMLWDEGDDVALRSRWEIERRVAVLQVLLTKVFGASQELTLGWLQRNKIDDELTGEELRFLQEPPSRIEDEWGLHIEAQWALAWLLGVADELDPTQYAGEGLANWAPDLRTDEPFETWRLRSPVQMRSAQEAASLLDLHYCLDWGMAQAMRDPDAVLPGVTQPYVVGQRRWALEWAVLFSGPHHGDPPAWDEIEFGL